MDQEICWLSATELAEGIRNKTFSSQEVVQAHLGPHCDPQPDSQRHRHLRTRPPGFSQGSRRRNRPRR